MIFINYNVSQFAETLGISVRTAYRYVNRLKVDFPQCIVTISDSDSDSDTVLSISDKGVDYAFKHYKKRVSSSPSADASLPPSFDTDIVNSLLFQLEEKDRQIAEKDKQISSLLQQNSNYQLIIAQVQGHSTPFFDTYIEKTETPKKKHWWNRSKK